MANFEVFTGKGMRFGVHREPRGPIGRPRTFDHDLAMKLHGEGLKSKEIGEMLGVSRKTVYLALWKRGVRERQPR